MSLSQLRALLVDAGEVAANKALTNAGLMSATLSKAQANRMYGKAQVDRWEQEESIHSSKDGGSTSKIRYDRLELDAVSKASNRHTFLNTNERR